LRSLLQSYPQGDKARFITAQEASTSGPAPFHFSHAQFPRRRRCQDIVHIAARR
jgi:hypothetical protein